MKQVVFVTMKFNTLFFALLLTCSNSCFSQEKKEREQRIQLHEFPEVALSSLQPYLEGVKRLRFYREVDGDKTSLEAKFKKGRLFYSIEFDSLGALEDAEYIIKKVDIPAESWKRIEGYIDENYTNARIKKIQQQYPSKGQDYKKTLRDSFQNLLLPYINYELIVSSKDKKGFQEYELLFDSKGDFLKSRKSSPQKYDHVLY